MIKSLIASKSIKFYICLPKLKKVVVQIHVKWLYCPHTTKPIKTRILLSIDNKICLKGRTAATPFPENYCPKMKKNLNFSCIFQKIRIFAV